MVGELAVKAEGGCSLPLVDWVLEDEIDGTAVLDFVTPQRGATAGMGNVPEKAPSNNSTAVPTAARKKSVRADDHSSPSSWKKQKRRNEGKVRYSIGRLNGDANSSETNRTAKGPNSCPEKVALSLSCKSEASSSVLSSYEPQPKLILGRSLGQPPENTRIPCMPGDLLQGSILNERYEIHAIYGRGQFAVTYSATDRVEKKVVAIKRLGHEWAELGLTEAHLLKKLQHSTQVVNIYGTFWTLEEDGSRVFHIVLEPLQTTPVFALPPCKCLNTAHSSIACPVRHRNLGKMMSQILAGLFDIHHCGLLHADLKPDNVLFGSQKGLSVKLIDLGNAIRHCDRDLYASEFQFDVQSSCYRAPEMMLGSGPVGRQIDVWSAGIIAIELLFGDDVSIPGGLEGASAIMRSPVEGRDAAVRRMIEIFGSLEACEDGMFWRDVYKVLGTRWTWDRACDSKVNNGPRKGALVDVLRETNDKGMNRWLLGMVDVNPFRRSTVDGALRDPWLVQSLLGRWGDVLQNPHKEWLSGGEDENSDSEEETETVDAGQVEEGITALPINSADSPTSSLLSPATIETNIPLPSPPPNYQLFPTTSPALMLPSDAADDDDIMLVGME